MDEKETQDLEDTPTTTTTSEPADTPVVSDTFTANEVNDSATEAAAEPVTPASEQKNNRSLFFFAGIAAVVLALAGIAYMQFGNTGEKTNETGELNSDATAGEPIAYVNGITITRETLTENISQLAQGAAQNGLDVNDMVVKAQLETQAYDITINNELLRQAAVEAIEAPTEEKVQAEIDTLITQNGGAEEFAKLLVEFNLTEENVRKNISDNLHIQAYLDTKLTETEVTDEDIQTFYDSLGGEEAGVPPLTEVRDQVIAELKNQNDQAQIKVILDELRAKAQIEKV